MSEAEEGPWVVWYDNPNGNDYDGSTEQVAFFRSKANAEKFADHRNGDLLSDANRRSKAHWDSYHQQYLKNMALVSAGLEDPRSYLEQYAGEFVPSTELRKDSEHYYVEQIEFED